MGDEEGLLLNPPCLHVVLHQPSIRLEILFENHKTVNPYQFV
jgi:hypothetical protein